MRQEFVFKIPGKHGVFGYSDLQKFGKSFPIRKVSSKMDGKVDGKCIEAFDARTGCSMGKMTLEGASRKFG
jgi:hypothetical protein